MSLDISKLYAEHKNAVRVVLLQYELNYDLVDELMQDTFVAALEAAPSFKGDAQPVTWLCGIAKNVARNHVRAAMRSVDVVSEAEFVGGDVESYADTLNASNPSDDPAELSIADDLYADALRFMPSNMEMCVIMRGKGHTNSEIADEVGISTSRVSAYLSESKEFFN